jgi:hypothetical protein
MISPKVLLGILIVVILGGLTLLVFEHWIIGSIITVIGLVLLYLWWRMNQLLQVSDALMKQDLEKARRELGKIKRPEKLNPYSRTYYYFFQGMIDIQSNNFKAARQGFKAALDTNHFRSVDERATALLMMAQLDLRNRNMEGAKRFLREAKSLEPSDQVRDQINLIVKQARLRL